MKSYKIKKAVAFLLTVIFTLSFSVISFAENVTGEAFFGYNTSLKSPENGDNPYGLIMWGALTAVILIQFEMTSKPNKGRKLEKPYSLVD